MTSQLTKTEFESRLKDLISKGEPTIMGTPFAVFTIFKSSRKPFYGEYNDTNFRITLNKIPVASCYIINGHFSESGTKTTLNYEIKPTPFSYYWIRLVPIFGFLFFNGILLFLLKNLPWDFFLIMNGSLGIMTLMVLIVDRYQRKTIEERFLEEFEIEKKINKA